MDNCPGGGWTTVQQLESSARTGAQVQEMINEWKDCSARKDMIEDMVRIAAMVKSGRYPQYWGHYDNWELVVVNRKIKPKGGVAFEKGDVSIGQQEQDGRWVVYSTRSGIDVILNSYRDNVSRVV